MQIKFIAIIYLLILSIQCFSQAPRIIYSDPEREDSRRTEFEVIGKVAGNFLVYKNNRSDHDIGVYDNDMKLRERVKLDADYRWINVDFIAYPDFFYMIYQYQRRNTLYCVAVKLDGNGQAIGPPIDVDTTQIGFAANNKIYTVINSEDKKRIMVFKINNRNQKNFFFTTLLFNEQLELLGKNRLNIPMEERNDFFTDFLLSNEGDLVFGKFRRSANSDLISKVMLVTKTPEALEFSVNEIETGKLILDELKLKIDNSNKRILLNALYYKQRRGNIEGLYSLRWDKNKNVKINDSLIVFNDELRSLGKSSEANKKMAFNDYFIKHIITRKDGGYLVIGESLYSTSRGNTFNRWNYLNWGNPWISPLDYYYWSPAYNNPWYMPWNRYGNVSSTRYYAENVMVLSFNREGGLEWSNIINKSQYDDESDNMISFQIMNTGSEIHFLFNHLERRKLLLNDQSLSPDGNVIRNPTLKNLDKGYEFMPRFAKTGKCASNNNTLPLQELSLLCKNRFLIKSCP